MTLTKLVITLLLTINSERYITQALYVNEENSFEDIFLTQEFEVAKPEGEDLNCSFQVVESIPEGLVYNESSEWTSLSTFKAWQMLLNGTVNTLDLASSYWSLRGKDVYKHPSDWEGEWIYSAIKSAAEEKGISIRIAQNDQPNKDTEDLSKVPGIKVRALNFKNLIGAGILHTKLWISDKRHFYVGSANFDWRSLTQVKEIGVLAMNCPKLAEDMTKIYEVYWALGGPGKTIPDKWPAGLETSINAQDPLNISGEGTSVYLSSSPPQFCPQGREIDIDAISHVISSAEKFIHIAVMDYSPSFLFAKNHQFWPVIDNLLRKAYIERGVEVKLLFSYWDHTKPDMQFFMKSLMALTGLHRSHNNKIEAKFFKVPAFTPDQAQIPFARVNHNKYMVTDKHGFIGTSNWSADYFVNTGGIGFVFKKANQGKEDSKSPPTNQQQTQEESSQLYTHLNHVFLRDWTSDYTFDLD